MEQYQFDACSLIAFFSDEQGAEKVEELLKNAEKNNCSLFLHKINLYEIYYNSYRDIGKKDADEEYYKIIQFPISIIDKISDSVLAEAARLKINYKISLADSIALAEASVKKATLVTSDHHEFDFIEKNETIKFLWIR